MNKEINLEQIFDEEDLPFILSTYKKSIIRVMRNACNQVVDLCADNAETDYTILEDNTLEVYVLKNSILDCKRFIK